jgi:hypothetical protein
VSEATEEVTLEDAMSGAAAEAAGGAPMAKVEEELHKSDENRTKIGQKSDKNTEKKNKHRSRRQPEIELIVTEEVIL